ncbi:MAG: hypothetical protein JWP91_2720 [Fibrobacteres bacterium]|nr:hypothetical protein [Fibrobacterota bacterium]
MRALFPATLPFLISIAVSAAGAAPSVKTGPAASSPAAVAKPSSGTAAPANAQPKAGRFEGVIDMNLAMEAGGGDMRLFLSGDRAKLNLALQVNPLPAPIQLGVLLDAKTPKVVWLVNDNLKTYSYLNISDALPPADTAGGKYVLKVLGKEKILGYECTHLTLTRPHELVDAWITNELPDVYGVLKKLQEANPAYGDLSIFRALEDAGRSGMPMKYIVVRDGQRVTMTVRKTERKPLPAAMFTVPRDYKKSEAGGLTPSPEQMEQMKKMIEGALENQ